MVHVAQSRMRVTQEEVALPALDGEPTRVPLVIGVLHLRPPHPKRQTHDPRTIHCDIGHTHLKAIQIGVLSVLVINPVTLTKKDCVTVTYRSPHENHTHEGSERMFEGSERMLEPGSGLLRLTVKLLPLHKHKS